MDRLAYNLRYASFQLFESCKSVYMYIANQWIDNEVHTSILLSFILTWYERILGCVWFAFLFFIFIFYFYLLKTIFIFKKLEFWKHIWFDFLLSTFRETCEGNVFLDLLKIIFLDTAFSFYPKWGSCFQLKTRFYYFHFLVHLEKYFYWKYFQKSNKTHFHHHFLFQ